MSGRGLKGSLLATSSALALVIGVSGSAQAGACTTVTNPSLPYSQAGNTCVTFSGFTGTGSVTSSGTVTPGPTQNAIAVTNSSTINGNITNGGTITAKATGILVTGGSSVGSSASGITNAGTITTSTGPAIYINGGNGGIGGSITNASTGVIISNAGGNPNGQTGGGISLNGGSSLTFSVGSITNNGTITTTGSGRGSAPITASAVTVDGNIINTGKLTGTNTTGVISIVNGGNIYGSVENSGTIINTNPYGGGIYIFPPTSQFIPGELVTGSIENLAGGTINGAYGIQIFETGTTYPVNIGGNVSNAGTITAGVTGIQIGSATINGAVSNSGTITAVQNGIQLINLIGPGGPAIVNGGVTNSGTITSTGTGYAGIALDGGQVSGGITNTVNGTISAANGVGILLSNTGKLTTSSGIVTTVNGGASKVTGGITNAGTITAKTGIMVTGGSTIDFITNSGTITGTGAAINLTGEGAATTINVLGGAISGNIVGAGSDTLNFTLGSGTFTYGSNFTGIGQVNVNSGVVVLNGTANSATNVDVYGGTLAGTGTIDPLAVTIHSGGTFAPGPPGPPGTSMTITGNLAFQSGAIYQVYLNPTATTYANVSGTATLAGTVNAAFASGSYAGKQYTILQSSGISGTFSAVSTTNLPAGFAVSLAYTGNDVLLDLSARLGVNTPGGLNQNQQNVANALNNYFNSGGTLPPGFTSLFGLTGGNLANALSQLDGEVATGGEFAAFQMMVQFLDFMLDPFVDGRLGGFGSGGGQAIGFAPDVQASLPPDVALAYASILKAPPQPTFDQRWTAWGSAYGGANSTNGNAAVGSSNLTAQTFGFAGGMDYHVTPDTIFGFALGGGGANWGLATGNGTGRSDAFQAGVYGITRAGPAYVSGALAFANHWMTTNRVALGDQLQANFDAQSYGARVEGGYRLAVLPTLGVTPYAALQAQDFHTPSYSESDLTGGGLGLSYASMNATDVRTELGSRFDAPTLVGGMPLILRGRLAWAHDFVNNPSLSAAFESLPGTSFVVNGAPMPQNSALTSAGAELFITPHLTLLTKFDGELASGSETYGGSGTLRYTW